MLFRSQSFIEHTGSRLSKNSFPTNTCFSTYRFSSESGTGYTSIYELNAFASICIAEHSYHRDFEYTIISDESISIHQYDSIDSDRSYLRGDVYSGLQYIGHTSDNELCRYVIKKNVPAKVIAGHSLMVSAAARFSSARQSAPVRASSASFRARPW